MLRNIKFQRIDWWALIRGGRIFENVVSRLGACTSLEAYSRGCLIEALQYLTFGFLLSIESLKNDQTWLRRHFCQCSLSNELLLEPRLY